MEKICIIICLTKNNKDYQRNYRGAKKLTLKKFLNFFHIVKKNGTKNCDL